MTIVCADWNHNGSCLAIAGKQPLSAAADGGDQGGKKSSSNTNAIQFFSHTGEARLFFEFVLIYKYWGLYKNTGVRILYVLVESLSL